VHYTAEHETVGEDFKVDESVMEEFNDFLDSKEFEHSEEDWTEENTGYAKLAIKREVFRKLFGTKGAYIATLPEDDEVNAVLEMFREAPTLEEMFAYVSEKRELAKSTADGTGAADSEDD
jgi:hypothetical protein